MRKVSSPTLEGPFANFFQLGHRYDTPLVIRACISGQLTQRCLWVAQVQYQMRLCRGSSKDVDGISGMFPHSKDRVTVCPGGKGGERRGGEGRISIHECNVHRQGWGHADCGVGVNRGHDN